MTQSQHIVRDMANVLAYFSATCVGMQRIESDAHWPSDVFLSAAFAIAVPRGVIGLHEQRKVSVQPLSVGQPSN